MRVLYIGQYGNGSTSQMRGEHLKALLNAVTFKVINIDVPNATTNRVSRSIGWRFKTGPLIKNINQYISSELQHENEFDLVWVDKGVFIRPEIISKLKTNTNLVVHYTPDPAFYYHRSKLFYAALPNYDFCVSTKTFETENYKRCGAKAILQTTQGYDPLIHRPFHSFSEKKGVVFIGHYEEEREELIAKLLERKVHVKLAGINWGKFAYKNKANDSLTYFGKGIYGLDYSREISGSFIGLGFLSNIIPEKHTTRTFEIPACGTALFTVRNDETSNFFSDEEAVFYESAYDFLNKIAFCLHDLTFLKELTNKGYQRVVQNKVDYKSIMQKLLIEMSVLKNENSPVSL